MVAWAGRQPEGALVLPVHEDKQVHPARNAQVMRRSQLPICGQKECTNALRTTLADGA